MGVRFVEQEREIKSEQVVCMSPPSEILWNQDEAFRIWPEINKNRLFFEQLKNHQENSVIINGVLDKLPVGKEMEEAIDQGIVVELEVISFYKSINLLLENEDYRRLVLYLPFETIPSVEWKSDNQELNQSVNQFKSNYFNAWVNLLSIQDVRANFVDGDVIEFDVRQSDPQRVVKAAHLIPELVKKGLLNKKQVLGLAGEVSDPVLKKSINDVLPIMLDLGQITKDEFDQYFKEISEENKLLTEPVTGERKKWLAKRQKENEVIEKAKAGIDNSSDEAVSIEGIRMAVEKDQKLSNGQKESLLKLGQTNNNDLKDRLVKTWRHFYGLGLIDKNQLDQLGIKLPNLSGKFSENMPDLSTEIEELKYIVTEIKLDPILKKSVMPVILIRGSKVKGYGESTSDTDISIFIKPGVSGSDKTQIREKLLKALSDHNFDHIPTEFWLTEQGDKLKINDDLEKDRWMAENDWLHVLLNSFWLGDKTEINELRTKLLPSFFEVTNEIKHQRPIREIYFENMEKDLLQYRLMHKGYESHFSTINNPFKKKLSIDGASAFWDPGFRKLATKLFVNNIFLPKF